MSDKGRGRGQKSQKIVDIIYGGMAHYIMYIPFSYFRKNIVFISHYFSQLEHCLSKKRPFVPFFCIFKFLFINKIMAKNNFSSNHKYTNTQEGTYMQCFRINVLVYMGPTETKNFYFLLFSIFRFSAKRLCGQEKPKRLKYTTLHFI